jgi:hypothetical protein
LTLPVKVKLFVVPFPCHIKILLCFVTRMRASLTRLLIVPLLGWISHRLGIILKWILEEQFRKMWTGFRWLMIWSGGEPGYQPSDFMKDEEFLGHCFCISLLLLEDHESWTYM